MILWKTQQVDPSYIKNDPFYVILFYKREILRPVLIILLYFIWDYFFIISCMVIRLFYRLKEP